MTARRRSTRGSRGTRGPRGRSARPRADERKDRLVQTRVPRHLEDALKEEAGRRRLSISHLIRNVLEDALDIVDDVVAGVDDIVSDSMDMAFSVQKDARRLAKRTVRSLDAVREGRAPREPSAGDEAEAPAEGGATPASPAASVDPLADLSHVDAWNRVTLNKDVRCARCGEVVARGGEGHLGVSSDPSAPTTWLCDPCLRLL